ncbi:YybS family protein [Radiobacillus sp. PE A8.2]|uniref:YybS family protein n=1 Tax=Radiobacillus sp. PE A8.2 TaxID=3380349 RepID=UPI00388E91D5
MKNSRQITEGAILTAIYIVLLFITIYVPLLGSISMFAIPVPFVIYAYRHGWKPSLMMGILAVILTILVSIVSIPLTILSGLGGIIIGSAMNQKLTPYETWARGTLGFVVGIIFTLLISQWLLQVNFVDELNQMMDLYIETTESMIEQFNMQVTEADLELIQQLTSFMIDLLPTMIVLMGIIMAFIAQWISYKIVNRINKTDFRFPKFRDFKLPTALIWIYLFAMIVSFFQQDPSGVWYVATVNVLNLAGILIVLQGISFVLYYSYVKKLPKAVTVIVIIALLLIPHIGLYLLRILGIIDLGFSIRGLIK